jgi:hypothetical protein
MTDNKEHYNVLICTPGHSMEAEYVKSLVETLKILDSKGITYKYLSEYSSTVSGAREGTLMGSLFLDAFNTKPLGGRATYNKIFWIDSDISWDPLDFISLYQSDKDIISGVYVNNKGLPMFTQLESQLDISVLDMCKYKDVFEISAAGFGFIVIKNGIYEVMERPWFESIYQEIQNEDKSKTMRIPFGEDYSWCYRARHHGYKIFLDPKVKVNHNKKVSLTIKENVNG